MYVENNSTRSRNNILSFFTMVIYVVSWRAGGYIQAFTQPDSINQITALEIIPLANQLSERLSSQ